MSDILREFLVAIGYQVDAKSEKKAADSANCVEQAVSGADKRMTGAQVAGAAKRILEANREAGVRTKGAAALIAERTAQQDADDKHTKQTVARTKDREMAETDA